MCPFSVFRARKQIVIPLYAMVIESETGPARVKGGIFSLPMKKKAPAAWPQLTKVRIEEPVVEDDKGDEGVGWCGCTAAA